MKPFALLLAANVAAVAAAAVPSYKIVDKIAIGGDARWDYVYLDSGAHRLYVSHGKQTEVIDTQTDKVVGTLAGTNGVHGIAVANALGLIFTANGDDNAVGVYDLSTLKQKSSIKVGKKPDAIVYDAADARVVAFNGHSDNASIIDAKRGEVLATVELGGNPEFGVVGEGGKVYFNIENKGELGVLDVKAMKLTQHLSLKPCEEPSGLAMDDKQHLFSVCSNKTMAITDLATLKVTQTPIGAHPDGAVFMDGYAISANGGDGSLSVVGETTAGKFETVATIETGYGARTIAADPSTHKLYLPTADFKPAEGAAKRQGLPGTFHVLVLEKQ